MADALVLGGAVAMGGFAAGACAELVRQERLDLRRIVGASSGALSAAFLSACPTEPERLVSLWLDEATWSRAFTPDWSAIGSLRGLSSGRRVRELVERELPHTTKVGVPLRIVVADAAGAPGSIGAMPATTFERVLSFDAPRFVGGERQLIIEAVLASAAFPGLFAPRGSLLDGGTVANTPIKEALSPARDVDRVFVVAPYPRVLRAEDAPQLRGLALATHLAEMLIHEPLYRDLREAEDVNRALVALRAAAGIRYAAVLDALGWTGRRVVDVVEVRPERPLRGTPIDGFFSRDLREEYVAIGREATRRALSRHHVKEPSQESAETLQPWSPPTYSEGRGERPSPARSMA